VLCVVVRYSLLHSLGFAGCQLFSICQFGIRDIIIVYSKHDMTCHASFQSMRTNVHGQSNLGVLGLSWSLVAGHGPGLDPGQVGGVPGNPREDHRVVRSH